jgi:hypothetical protein
MNLGELRTEVKNRLAIPTAGDGLITDTIVNGTINSALRVITTTRDWPWLLTSSQLAFPANVGYAEIPCEFIRAKELVIDLRRICYVEINEFIDQTLVGYPYVFTMIGNQVKLFPVPTTLTLGTMYYYRSEPELTIDTQNPIMPEFLQGWIVSYAAYLCALRRQDEGTAGIYFAESNDLLNRMRDDVRRKTGRRIQTMGRYTNADRS